jgi:DNA repair protein RadC
MCPARFGFPHMKLKSYTPHEFKILPVRECGPLLETLDTPERAADYWLTNIPGAPWFDPAKEAFVVLILNTRRRVLGHNMVTVGSLDSCLVTPLAVFRPALVMAAHAVILAHNQPSQDPSPSEADIRVTRELLRAGQLLKIEVLDHIIVGGPSPERARPWVSLRELGYLQ